MLTAAPLLSILEFARHQRLFFMTEPEIDAEFGHIWTTALEQYVLLQNSAFSLGYVILHRTTNTMLIIERDDAAAYVLAQLVRHGCPVVTTAPCF